MNSKELKDIRGKCELVCVEVVYSCLECGLLCYTKENLVAGVGYPCGKIVGLPESEGVELVGVGRAEGSSFGGALWQEIGGVDVDVGGVSSSDNVAFEIKASK